MVSFRRPHFYRTKHTTSKTPWAKFSNEGTLITTGTRIGVDPLTKTFDCLIEGISLSRQTFQTFYSSQHRQFCSPYDEPGTIDAQHGYLCWPVSIGFWAVANAAKSCGEWEDRHMVERAFEALEKHWNPQYQGYCAWVMFDGNRDLYFDDNAHCGNALVTAFEATHERRYLDRARDIVTGLLQHGWDRYGTTPGAGGVAWHIDHNEGRNACSTLSAAVLACRLAMHGVERAYCMEMAASCIRFADAHLVDQNDGLVLDSYRKEEDGQWRNDARKFTYNTGFCIEAYLLYSELSGDKGYLKKATKMALTAIDPTCVLFDNTLDPPLRIWWDSVFFAHHLVEALVLVALQHGMESDSGQRIRSYLARLAGWCHGWLRETGGDGLYFRELRPYFIDQSRTEKFNSKFGTHHVLTAVEGDRANGTGPVSQRPLIKTLLGNASMANIYLYMADLQRNIPALE